MDDEEKQRELKRWKRWDFLGIVVWILTFGPIRWLLNEIPWRGRHYPRKPPRFGYEPPMLSLAKLAEDGLIEPPPQRIRDSNTIGDIVRLFAFVGRADKVVTDEEIEVLRSFLKEHGPEALSVDEEDRFVNLFKSSDATRFNIKNHCFLLAKGLKHNQTKLVFEAVNHLAYLHGLEQEELRLVFKIGEYLGLTSAEIRLADTAGRQAAEGSRDTEERKKKDNYDEN